MRNTGKILVTGFEPFGEDPLNASWQAVKQLPDRIGALRIIKKEIPVVQGLSVRKVIEAMELVHPDAVIMTGQAGGRSAVSVELYAVNCDDYRIPDNGGHQPKSEKIAENGPERYETTLPAQRILDRIRAKGIPAELSQSAGTFVCNHLFYSVRHYCRQHAPDMPAGFIHVPYMDLQLEGRALPCLTEGQIVKALEAAVEALQEEGYGTF